MRAPKLASLTAALTLSACGARQATQTLRPESEPLPFTCAQVFALEAESEAENFSQTPLTVTGVELAAIEPNGDTSYFIDFEQGKGFTLSGEITTAQFATLRNIHTCLGVKSLRDLVGISLAPVPYTEDPSRLNVPELLHYNNHIIKAYGMLR